MSYTPSHATYAAFVGVPALPDLIDPSTLRGFKSDGEAARAATAPEWPVAQRATRGLDSWTIAVLEAIDAPAHGTGKNGAWTKADFEALVG